MKISVWVFSLCLLHVHASDDDASKKRSWLGSVDVAAEASNSAQAGPKQSKRSLGGHERERDAEAGYGATAAEYGETGAGFAGTGAGFAGAGVPIQEQGALGAFQHGLSGGPASAVAQVVPAPGLYTAVALEDAEPVAVGTGYAPAYAAGYDGGVPLGEQVVHQRVEITRPVPVPVYRTVAVAVPHPVPFAVPHPVAVEVPHPVPYEVRVPVVKTVPYPVEKAVPYPVDRPYPVQIIKKVPVPVPKPYPVHVPIYKVKHIHHHNSHW